MDFVSDYVLNSGIGRKAPRQEISCMNEPRYVKDSIKLSYNDRICEVKSKKYELGYNQQWVANEVTLNMSRLSIKNVDYSTGFAVICLDRADTETI